ncbi:MAG: type II secretion system GspH family protein [Candidatus Accumulibacter sp.]|jgi:prepilin-type N-terminal cleavage/methylation domain-containing protein|nr:type II secretion system GspH family protein [Accumulibacter sp.]
MSTVFRRFPKSSSGGFSLVEMSVALAVVGVLAFALWKILPRMRAVDDTRPVEEQIALADEAIQGFVMKNHRLPCPDTDGDGSENVSSPSGPCDAAKGGFPFHTLGLSLPARLRYGAYQDGSAPTSLTQAVERHTPMLPPVPPGGTEWPMGSAVMGVDELADYDGSGLGSIPPEYAPSLPPTNPIKNLSTLSQEFARSDPGLGAARLSGLDFCAALRDAQPSPLALTALNSNEEVNVAYIIAHPGALDADGNGSFFDLRNDADEPVFEPPNLASSDAYDDRVLAVGFGELAARLSCTSLLSRANAAGHMARATYDHFRFALAYLKVRAFLLDMAFSDLQAAYSGVTLSVFNLVSAISTAEMTIAAGAMTLDEGVGAALFAVGTALTVGGVAEATAELVSAVGGLDGAIDSVNDAISARIEADVHARKMLTAANETARYAVELDTKGLLP